MHLSYPKIRFQLDPETRLSQEWVLTEKIHGANLALTFQNGELNLAKRKEIIAPDKLDQFFNVSEIYPMLFTKAQKIITSLPANSNWTLYGELCGRGYPDESAVQQGVFYSPVLVFAAFDLAIEDEFVSYDYFRDLCDRLDIITVPLLARGRYQALIQHEVAFETKLPKLLGLDPLPDNLAEGWVLKPASGYSLYDRPILKKKREEFSEDLGQIIRPVNNSAVPDWLLVSAVNKITVARIQSARSKLGHTGIEELIHEVCKDVIEDLIEEVGALSPEIINHLEEIISKASKELI